VTAEVVGVDGRLVHDLATGVELSAGRHVLEWDGTDRSGRRVPSGVYFFRTSAGGTQAASKVLLLH
jgi:flagellar hook assembly protein FlgD